MTISRVNKFSYLPYAREMNVLFHQSNVLTFWWILPNEIFWPSLFTKLLFRNISGVIPLYDQSVKSWEFRIREMRYCWEGNTMLLRGKCDVLINVTWDCFDQSNFYIGIIHIIEWNNIQLVYLCCDCFVLMKHYHYLVYLWYVNQHLILIIVYLFLYWNWNALLKCFSMLVHKSEKDIYISNNYKAKGNEKQKVRWNQRNTWNISSSETSIIKIVLYNDFTCIHLFA